MNKVVTEATQVAPVSEGDAWDRLGGNEDIDLGNPDDPGYEAVPSGTADATDQPTIAPAGQQADPADVVPEFVTAPGEFSLEDFEEGDGSEEAATENAEGQQDTATDAPEPWANDPTKFDFRTLPAAERAEAFQRFTAQHPDLALQRTMLYEGFQDKAQEASTATKALEEMQRRLSQLEDERTQAPDNQAELQQTQQDAADYAAWEASYRNSHNDQAPNFLEISRWMAERVTGPQFAEVRPTIETLNKRAEQQLIADVTAQMDTVKAEYPEAHADNVEEEVFAMLAAMLQSRPDQALRDDDVEKAFLAVRGKELMDARLARETTARQTQAAARKSVPTVAPSAASSAPVPGPAPNAEGAITLEAVQAYQRKRGAGTIIRDYVNKTLGGRG